MQGLQRSQGTSGWQLFPTAYSYLQSFILCRCSVIGKRAVITPSCRFESCPEWAILRELQFFKYFRAIIICAFRPYQRSSVVILTNITTFPPFCGILPDVGRLLGVVQPGAHIAPGQYRTGGLVIAAPQMELSANNQVILTNTEWAYRPKSSFQDRHFRCNANGWTNWANWYVVDIANVLLSMIWFDSNKQLSQINQIIVLCKIFTCHFI